MYSDVENESLRNLSLNSQRKSEVQDNVLFELSKFIELNETNPSIFNKTIDIDLIASDPLNYASIASSSEESSKFHAMKSQSSALKSSHPINHERQPDRHIEKDIMPIDLENWKMDASAEMSENISSFIRYAVEVQVETQFNQVMDARFRKFEQLMENKVEAINKRFISKLVNDGQTKTNAIDIQNIKDSIYAIQAKQSYLEGRIDEIEKQLKNSNTVHVKSIKDEIEKLKSTTTGIQSEFKTQIQTPNPIRDFDFKFHQRLSEVECKIEQIKVPNTLPTGFVDMKLRDEVSSIKKKLHEKVESSVIEELMRHIATREELQSLSDFIKRHSLQQSPKASTNMEASLIKSINETIKHFRKDIEMRIRNQEKWMKNEVKAFKTLQKSATETSEIKKETRMMTSTDMDDKFEILCREVSACKQAWQQSVRQPFYRCAQWIWKSGLLKSGTSAVPWNIESSNTDSENMIWDEDSAVIKVVEGGLYEISFAFFTKTKPSIQIIVNGESVLSAINSPSYVVHHSSGYVIGEKGALEAGTVTGLSLVDYLALPFKSTISLYYHGGRKGMLGHGFLSLRKL